MKDERIDAVALKRTLQKQAKQKLAQLAEEEQLELLRRKYGHLTRRVSKHKPRTRRELQVAWNTQHRNDIRKTAIPPPFPPRNLSPSGGT